MQIQTWHAFCKGEKSAGLPSLSADVFLPMPLDATQDEIEFVRQHLIECFAKIWDDKYTRVLTDIEIFTDPIDD